MASAEQQLADLQELVNVLQQQIVTLGTGLDSSRLEVETLRSQSKTAFDRFEQTEKRIDNSGRNHRNKLVDAKGARPEVYNNDRTKFKQWARRVKAYCNGLTPGMRKVMAQAEQHDYVLTEQYIDDMDIDDAQELDSELYDLLMTITDGESQTMVENTPGEEPGFEAWRKVVRWFDPTNSLNEMDKVNQLISVPRCKKIADVTRAA